MVFSDLEDCLEFEVALKDIYLFTFGCFRGTLVVSNVLGRFFFSSEIVTLATLMGRTYLSVYTQICVCGAYSHEFYFYYSQIVFTPFAVHYQKIRNHLRKTATNSAKIHSLARKSEHLRINQIQ